MRDSRLTRAKQNRLNMINEVLGQFNEPKRTYQIDVDFDKSTLYFMIKWLVNVGFLTKSPVIIDGVESNKAYIYARTQEKMSVEEFFDGRRATSKRKVVELKQVVVKDEWKAEYINGVMNVPERRPTRRVVKTGKVYVGCSFDLV